MEFTIILYEKRLEALKRDNLCRHVTHNHRGPMKDAWRHIHTYTVAFNKKLTFRFHLSDVER